MEILCTLSKPLLMPTLALWLASETEAFPIFLRKGWLIGLGFSTLGDILLIQAGSMFFIGGLSAFLCAHLAYITSIHSGLRDRLGFLRRQPPWVLPFVLYLLGLLAWLWNGIPQEMRIPVSLYAVVITTMALSVCHLRGNIPGSIWTPMLAGAILFVVSDSLIAVNKFGHPFEGARLAIMVTYLVGQWLLARSVVGLVNGKA